MYRQHQDGVGQQYQLIANPSPYGYSPFSANIASAVDPGFYGSPQHLSPRPVMPRQISHVRHISLESQDATRMASRSMSPRFSSSTPSRFVPFTPTDRSLPSKDVKPDTITDAYVAFILYCNPSFPMDIETKTLRTNFESPPKSDNKDFQIYRLFELIQLLDSKEIKTWGQLAFDLGVEAPDISKGQSTQKVQQYTVRLKRWMRAMHVDAFFEYLLNKDHTYFTEIPPPNDPHPSNGRDGVAAEEDLAIRALDPAFRPKRGRRRNSDVELELESEAASANKQPRLMSAVQDFASSQQIGVMPISARPENSNDPWAVASAVTPQTFAPWASKRGAVHTSMPSAGPTQFRWQVQNNSQEAMTPHPLTAHPSSMADEIDAAFENEPKSAITPSTRRRRKHGPAVSSAWPSASGTGAKPRGRPPAGRSTQDGPFSSFPADPNQDKSREQSFIAPIAEMESAVNETPVQTFPAPASRPNDGNARPGRLSLQVPAHTGGPVRLATPPRVLVNGETNDSEGGTSQVLSVDTGTQIANARSLERQKPMPTVERELPGFAFEALKRVVASDLLRAELVGRRNRLNGDEAKRLADAVLERFNIPRADTDSSKDDIARLTAASWLGVGEQLNVPLGPAIGQNKRVIVTRFRIDDEGYEEIVSPHDDGSGRTREVFDLTWTVSMGGCNGNFELKGLSLNEPEAKQGDVHDKILDSWYETAQRIGIGEDDAERLRQRAKDATFVRHIRTPDDNSIDWKSKYKALEFGMNLAKGEFDRFRQRAIEKLQARNRPRCHISIIATDIGIACEYLGQYGSVTISESIAASRFERPPMMARCRFLELPLEVRDLIFEFTVAEDAYDADDIRASSEYRRKRIAISRSDRWAWEAHHQSQAPFPEYLCLQLCNRQLNHEIRQFLSRPQRTPAVITMLLEYPHMWSIFTKLAQPPGTIECLDIEIKINHMYHPAYISRGSQSAILSAVSDIVKRFVHRGPHLSRPSPLARQLHLDTVRITLAPHLPLAALSQVYGFPEQQLETLFTDFKTLLTRFCRSGIPYGLIDSFEVRRERGSWSRLPVTSNIWDEQDFVFFQYGGYNWDRDVEASGPESFEPDLIPW